MVIVPSRQLPQCSDAQRHSGRQAAVGIALQAAVGAVSAAGTVERCAQLAPPPPAAGRAGASNRFIDSSRPYASDDVVDHGKQLATEAVANAAASNVPVVIDGRPPIRKLNMRGRSARPLCGTWSSRRAEYSKLIVYGNRSPSSTAAPVLAIIPASARYAGPALNYCLFRRC